MSEPEQRKRRTRSQRMQAQVRYLKADNEALENFAIDLLGLIDVHAQKLPPDLEQRRREMDFPMPGEIE